jgi:hydroxymethylpyrimidine pyrophosphatase-like HAD family hydrolase
MTILHAMPYKALVLDLDGTVVQHNLTIAPAVSGRLHRLITQTDCHVIIATGRMSVSAGRFAKLLGVIHIKGL